MKAAIILILATISVVVGPSDFISEQKNYERVKAAFEEKGKCMTTCLRANNINPRDLNILIVAYKAELELELYAKKKSETNYRKIQTYAICERSGSLGPKRQQGDQQVPEGFYYIDRFNPVSNFHLSLGINYPNQSDKLKGLAGHLGGDIFIHGACVTIGCLPMTDDKIKEIYLYAIQAKHNGQQKIPVYIFPFKMTTENFDLYKESYSYNFELLDFWKNIKTGFDKFAREKKELTVSVGAAGNYYF